MSAQTPQDASVYVDVWIGHPPWGPLTYRGFAREGEVVWVPLQQRVTLGVVHRVRSHPPRHVPDVRPLLGSTGAVLPPWVLQALQTLAHRTSRPPGDFLRFALPSGLVDRHRMYIRPVTLPLQHPKVTPSLLKALGKRRVWRSWDRLRRETRARQQDLIQLVEAGQVEIRTVFPRLISSPSAPPSPPDLTTPVPSLEVAYGLSLAQKVRWLRRQSRKAPVFLWCSDHFVAYHWARILQWPLYTSEQSLRDRLRIWQEALQGNLPGVVGTHAGFLLPFPRPHVVVEEPWMEGFLFQENLDLRTVVEALPLRRTLLFSGVHPQWVSRSAFRVIRRYPSRSPRWHLTARMDTVRSRLVRAVQQGHNVAIWIERKGFGFLRCEDCRRRLRCPRDATVLRLSHVPSPRLICPSCDWQGPLPSRCPSCGGERLQTVGRGLEYVARRIKQWIPEARILRVDGDIRTPRLRRLLHQVWERGGADVLVGTWAARTAFVHPATHRFVVWYPETFFPGEPHGEWMLSLRLAWLTWARETSPVGTLLTRRYDLELMRALQRGALRSYFRDLYRDAPDPFSPGKEG